MVLDILLNTFRQERMMKIHDMCNQIKGSVDTYKEFNISRDEMIQRIIARFGLRESVAAGYVDEYLQADNEKEGMTL